jgi:enterochelin esterase-like enzyme
MHNRQGKTPLILSNCLPSPYFLALLAAFFGCMALLPACSSSAGYYPYPPAAENPSATPALPTPSAAMTTSNTPAGVSGSLTPRRVFGNLTPSPTATEDGLGAIPPAPSAIPSPTGSEACLAEAGQIEHSTISTSLLGQPLNFRVYLPPCYANDPQRRYPVLYLLHGQGFTEDQWIRLGVAAAADQLIARGEIPPLLIVMPYDADWRQPDESNFGEAVTNVLLPWIDRQYRTIPERSSRAIGGLSRGAAWAVHEGLSRWELFGAIGAHSLPIFWSDSSQIVRWLDAIPPHALPRIYLDIGKNDPELSSAVEFEYLLNARNIPHEWYLLPGYHNEEYWQLHLVDYLCWYTSPW